MEAKMRVMECSPIETSSIRGSDIPNLTAANVLSQTAMVHKIENENDTSPLNGGDLNDIQTVVSSK